IIDTGSPVTILDKSLEPKLGKRQGIGLLENFGVLFFARKHAAPKLYLGGVPLVTGSNVWTMNLKRVIPENNPPIKGILGMDCLKHYCVQLDFKAAKMRFLDSRHLNAEELGEVFPLLFSTFGQNETDLFRPYIYQKPFFGSEATNVL